MALSWCAFLHTFLFVVLSLLYSIEGRDRNCSRLSSLVGFTAQLSMRQHQLRGQIEVLDDCSFAVSKFDMIAGMDVHWWGSKGKDFENMTKGFVISKAPLNRTFSSESLVVTLDNCTWEDEDFKVLGVWDKAYQADFGHLLLSAANTNVQSPTPALAPDLVPGPAPSLAPAPVLAPEPSSMAFINASDRVIYWGERQPTMFENCLVLNSGYRLRWTLNKDIRSVDLGVEAAVADTHYMALGWARNKTHLMLNADVVLGGFKNHTNPFVEDYYITKYSECTWDSSGIPAGVCPDSVYPGNDEDKSDAELKFLHGQWQDGVALIRYQKSLESSDKLFDVPIIPTDEMDVIWALGLLKQPDSLRPLYLPENHGTSFGHVKLNLSNALDQCRGPLQAPNWEDPDLIVAEAGVAIVVSVGLATRYPNPPNPDKVIYLNKIEAPALKVERGVQVTFLIQAGHEVAFYITDDPVGGCFAENATTYAGGSSAHGVPASPFTLAWKPDRFTPDEVYYQSYFQQKMGWKIRVVDGGLTDMYNRSALLADQKVMLYWMLTESDISFAVRAVPKSGYVAIGFGETMVNTFAYVGWLEDNMCRVGTYWIDGRDPSSIHPTHESLTDVQCAQQNGMLTFQFSRPLDLSCTGGQECRNIIDKAIPLKVVWALGTHWKADQLTDKNMHSSKSSKYMSVYLTRGVAEAEQELRPVLAVHGFIMFLAWALLFPGGVLAARYLKHLKNDGWFQIHLYAQYSGLAIMFLGVLFAVAEIREFHVETLHVRLGLVSIFLACTQPLNAFFRPKSAAPGEPPSMRRLVWQRIHKYDGVVTLVVGSVTLLTGVWALSSQYGGDQMRGVGWALAAWLLSIALLTGYLEFRAFKRARSGKWPNSARGTWIMGNGEEDDSENLLRSNHVPSTAGANHEEVLLYPAKRKEVQLQDM